MIFGDVRQTLLDDVTVSGLVGTRITSAMLPQKSTFPAIVLLEVTTTPTNSLEGDCNLDNHLMQVDCYAKTLADVKTLQAAVRSAINAETTRFRGLLNDSRYEYQRTPKTHRVSMDFSLW